MARNPYSQANLADFYSIPSPGKLLKYLRGNGNSFLTKNPWVGDQLEIAEELLVHQDEFEKSFQETFGKAKKLLESANHLAESKECDPQEIRLIAAQLETEVKTFTGKLKKRRELLKMAVSFFKNVQKLSKSVDKLKEEINIESGGTVEPQNFDEQLDRHRHECESTLEKILSTVQEGEQLSSELLQESSLIGKESKSSFFSLSSNSAEQSKLAVDLYLKELHHSRVQLEKLWRGRQQKLDYWVKVKHYERDTNTLYVDVTKWNSTWQKKELANDVNRAISMSERFENESKDLSQRFHALIDFGKQLENNLLTSAIDVTVMVSDSSKRDGTEHVAGLIKKLQVEYDVVKKIHHKLKVKYDFTIKQRKLEAEAKKVASWIRHGESILSASLDAGSSMYEAEALLREYERFHAAIETTKLGVSDICKTAKKLINDGHPDHIGIEKIAQDVNTKWESLMHRAKERRDVVFSSYNFYRAAENVSKLLEKFTKDCKSEEDPCTAFKDYELEFKLKKLESLIKKSEPEKKAVEDGCQKVKECSEEFLKKILPTPTEGETTPVIDGNVGRLEIKVNDLVEHVTSQEVYVLKQIQLRKTVLMACVEFVQFEIKVEETLKMITDQGLILSEGFKDLELKKDSEQTENEKEACLLKQEEYKTMFHDIREKVKTLLKEASQLVSKIHFHRAKISELATSINMRYQDLAIHMKQFRDTLETKLGCSVPEFEEEGEWPSLSALHAQSSDLVARRDVSNDSGIHEMTEEKRRSLKRIEFIIKELIQTEKAYVDDLECCIENFERPSYNNPELPEALQDQQEVIFGNIDHIHKFHSNVFLGELEKYERCAEQVGKCFTEWQDQFLMYVHYCANKPASNALLIEHGENFFEDLQMKRGLGLSLAAYLIKPVQRITKYQLLLKDLLSCCEDNDGTLQDGLNVMLSVPRRANDAMYLCMISGFYEGNLETLGKVLLHDSFIVNDPKHILKKGKERHVFLFEQALLFCKEMKEANGKCTYVYKSKLKTSELGLTEYMAEDNCKFAVWTGEPPFTEEKRVIKAESEAVKQMWVKEIRNLTQEFQFGFLHAKPSFYPTSPRKKSKKTGSQADISFASDGSTINPDRLSIDFDATTVCSRTSFDSYQIRSDIFVATESYIGKGSDEISLNKGQSVEVLSKPPGSRCWRVRVLDEIIGEDIEGFIPHLILRRLEESPMRGKRNSVETLNSQSSEDSFQTDSPKGSMVSVSGGRTSPKSRRRTKSAHLGSTLNRMGTWSRRSSKKMSATLTRSNMPTTPSRSKQISGGGSKKLQALLGAPESDIDLLIRPSDGKYATLGRAASSNTEKVKFLTTFHELEDAGFQEGDYDSDNDSLSDTTSEAPYNGSESLQQIALTKRKNIIAELIQTEKEYVNELETVVLKYLQGMIKRSDIPDELKTKEKIIFGNLPQLLTFHKNNLLKDLEKYENSPDKLANVFLKSEKKFEMYVQYCANKPRSALLIHDHLDTFFLALMRQINAKEPIEELLMRPIQRIMRYHAIIKDILKYSSRAGVEIKDFTKALQVMQHIPKKADDVMHIGLLEGFPDNLNNQGKLLMQDSLFVGNAKTQEAPAERRVFLFEKVLIFSEPLERKANLSCYIYRHSVKMEVVALTTNYDEDPCKITIWTTKNKGGASSEIYIMIAKSPQVKKAWIEAIRKIIEHQYCLAQDIPDDIKTILFEYKHNVLVNWKKPGLPGNHGDDDGVDGLVNDLDTRDGAVMGKITAKNHSLERPIPTLQHVKLIPLNQLNNQEERGDEESYIVTENYHAQNADEITVNKNDIVYILRKSKKVDKFYEVRCPSQESSGLLPAKILKKYDDKSKVKRSSSFGSSDKQKKEKKRTKSNASSTLLRNASLKRKKEKDKRKVSTPSLSSSINDSPSKNVLQHWTKTVDSSDDEEVRLANQNAEESLEKILHRDGKTTCEVAPEFKILPRDVTVDAAAPVKLNCTVVAFPTPQISWTRNDQFELSSNSKYNISFKNHLCTFEIYNADSTDTGVYTVTATNELGSASCSAKINVRSQYRAGVPGKAWITSMTSSSVTLKWDPPIDLDTSPVKAYTVEYQEFGVSDWQVAIAVCNETTATVDDLTTNKTYIFRVLANSDKGISDPSEASEPMDVHHNNVQQLQGQLLEIRWRDNIEDYYNICGELGRGRFSIVKRCVEKSTNREYAAKIVRRRMMSKEDVESEVAILQSLNHRAIVSLHEIYDAPKGLVLVEQLLTGGRLFDHVVIMDLLTEEIAIRRTRELLDAIRYLHSLSIAHLDIKPENILLSGGDNAHVVLADFGDAIRLRKVPYQHDLSGNPEFSAPEVVAGDNVSLATDMWSIGVVVYVLLSGVSPFYSDNHERACANVTEIRYRFPEDFFSEISDEAKDFVEELLIRDQAHRPDAEECLNFSWLKMIENNTARTSRISLSRLAAFNARRRYQYEITNSSNVTSNQLLSPDKKKSGSRR